MASNAVLIPEHQHDIVGSVVLHIEGSSAQSLMLTPGITRRNKPHYLSQEPSLPSRTYTHAAPSGDIQLYLSIDSKSVVGRGSSATVYDATIISVVSSSGLAVQSTFPPLVVKVAYWMEQDRLSREAWYYDEMLSLQGVCIPRCYGFFEVEGVSTCPLWGNSTDAQVIQFVRVNQSVPNDPNEPHTEPEKDYFHIDARQNVVSILVLEKLGNQIPRALAPEGIMNELARICDELCRLHILHGDIRYENILVAPSNGLPSLPSPADGRVHKWRLIDFGLAHMSNQSLRMMRESYLQELVTVRYALGVKWDMDSHEREAGPLL